MTSHVCWEWQRNDGGYCPYIPEVSSALEAAHVAGQTQLQVHPYVVDFLSMTQQRQAGGLGVTRTVRRNRIDFGSSPDVTAYWMWSENAGQSVPYQVEASVDIELAYQRNLPIVNLAKCSSQLPYTINFRNMDQTRHHFNTRRGIKRVPLSLGASLQSLLKESPSPVSSVPSAATLSGISRGLAPPTHGATSSTMNAHIPSSSVLSTATTRHGHHNRKPKGHVSLATTSPSYVPPLSASHLEHTPLLPVVSHLGHVSAPPHSSSHSGHTSALGTTPNFVHSPTVGLANTSTTSNWSVPTSTFSTLYTSTTTAMSTIPFGTTSAPRTSSTATKSKSSRSRSNAKSSTTKTSPVVMKASSRVKKSQKKTREIKPHLAVGGASNCCEAQEDPLSVYARKLKRLKAKDDEACPICMNKLSEESGFEDDAPLLSTAMPTILNVYKLRKCGHLLHHTCLIMYIKNSSGGGFQCPTCKKPYGVKMGDMPNGTMTINTYGSSLPGHSGHGTIQITYNFTPGNHTGKRYRAHGFPRTCYLPNSPKGQKVLNLLKVAWDRKLTFTIGTSVTTGAVDTVVWNEIHHKTESNSNHSGHGYPDPYYLDRVLLELAAQGVEDKEEEDDIGEESSDSSDEEEVVLGPLKSKDTAEVIDVSSSESL